MAGGVLSRVLSGADALLPVWLRLLEKVIFLTLMGRLFRRIGQQGLMRALVKPILSHIIAGARRVPGVKGQVNAEVQKEVDTIEKNMLGDGDAEAIVALPQKGLTAEEVKQRIVALKAADLAKVAAHPWAGIYHPSGTGLGELQLSAIGAFHETNALYPGIFPALRKMEAEAVSMALSLVHGKCGLLASGGTESVMIATLAHRERGRLRGIEDPEVICCRTAHPAIDKACHYFGLRLIKLEQGPRQELEPSAVRAALTSNTVLVYASAPTFPHGIVDPIEELGALCKEKDVGLHVDNCLGGIYLSFLQKLGHFKRKFDLSVPGVTSMSVDLHKYGGASKGASVVAFADTELRRLTYVPVAGIEFYVTATMQGSRGGGPVAAAWATLMHVGESGFKSQAERLWSVHEKVSRGISDIKGLKLLLTSDACIVPIAGDGVDIYAVTSQMEKRGWNLFTAREPSCMCLCYGEQHVESADSFLSDLRSSTEHVLANPKEKVKGEAAVYGAASVLPDDVLMEVMRSYCDIKMTVKPKA